jgi:catalase
MEANQSVGDGFFTTPGRTITGNLLRATSPTFVDVWSQPRLFFNSLIPVEQQFLINAIRFEVSHIQSAIVKSNVIIQLNRVSNDIAKRVAEVIGVAAPAPDPTFYNNNSTKFVTIFGNPLLTIATLNVGVLASVNAPGSLTQAAALASAFSTAGVNVVVVGEILQAGINQTYSAADATGFDGIIVATGAESLFTNGTSSTFFPANRPLQILTDGYRWGKPVGALGSATKAIQIAGITTTPGVFQSNGTASSDVANFVTAFEGGLQTFKFIDRFPIDAD